jgi:hypothetical protein
MKMFCASNAAKAEILGKAHIVIAASHDAASNRADPDPAIQRAAMR